MTANESIICALFYLALGSVLATYFGVIRRKPGRAVVAWLFCLGCAALSATSLPNVLFGI